MLNVRDLNTLMKMSWSYMKTCKPELTDDMVSEDELTVALSKVGKVDENLLITKLEEVLK